MHAATSFVGLFTFVLIGYAVIVFELNGRSIPDNTFSSCTAGSSHRSNWSGGMITGILSLYRILKDRSYIGDIMYEAGPTAQTQE